MQSSGLTLAMNLPLNFQGQIWNLIFEVGHGQFLSTPELISAHAWCLSQQVSGQSGFTFPALWSHYITKQHKLAQVWTLEQSSIFHLSW